MPGTGGDTTATCGGCSGYAGAVSVTLRERVGELRRGDTGRAAELGLAMIVTNVLALGFTIVFYLIFATGLGVWLPVGPFTQFFRDMGWILL